MGRCPSRASIGSVRRTRSGTSATKSKTRLRTRSFSGISRRRIHNDLASSAPASSRKAVCRLLIQARPMSLPNRPQRPRNAPLTLPLLLRRRQKNLEKAAAVDCPSSLPKSKGRSLTDTARRRTLPTQAANGLLCRCTIPRLPISVCKALRAMSQRICSATISHGGVRSVQSRFVSGLRSSFPEATRALWHSCIEKMPSAHSKRQMDCFGAPRLSASPGRARFLFLRIPASSSGTSRFGENARLRPYLFGIAPSARMSRTRQLFKTRCVCLSHRDTRRPTRPILRKSRSRSRFVDGAMLH